MKVVCLFTEVIMSWTLVFAQVDPEVELSAQEQMYLLYDTKLRCVHNISDQGPADVCPPGWDGLICWPRGFPGSIAKVPCPSYIYDFNHRGYSYRRCDLNGSWASEENSDRIWSNYSDCLRFLQSGREGGKKVFFQRLYVMYTIGYAVSFSSLLVAIFIIGYFRRLHCTRNYIHVHLFLSFMLRALSIFMKDRVVHASGGPHEIDMALIDSLKTVSVLPHDNSQYVGCKITVLLFIYFLSTNYSWILVEGLYLHSLIFMAFPSDTKPLWAFTLIGWGVPALFVSAWAVVRATVADARCWELSAGSIKWIYQVPILTVIGLNFILFVNIVRVLATKIRETNAGRYDSGKQYRKLARSTLVLVLVFGVHYIVFVGMPHSLSSLGWEARMYCELFFNSFQGFFVSMIYCYCNGEVQAEVRKAWMRWTLAFDWRGPATCSNYRCGSALPKLNTGAMTGARLASISCPSAPSPQGRHRSPHRADRTHTALPGYVLSQSDIVSLPPSFPGEPEEGAKHVDDVTLKHSLKCVLEIGLRENVRGLDDASGRDLVSVSYNKMEGEEAEETL